MVFIQYLFCYVWLLLAVGVTRLHALKYSFYNTKKYEYLLHLVQKYSHENSNNSTLYHILGLPLTWSGLYTAQKREFWNSFSGKNSVIF